MFRHTLGARIALSFAPLLTAGAFLLPHVAHAQTPRHTTRRTNANRQARIARNIQQTYSYKYELFGGGGYMRFRSGEYLQQNNMVTWAVSGTRNLSPEWGITADVRGAYGNAKIGNTSFSGVTNPLISEYTFMGGPQYRFYRKEKYAVSASAMAGVALGNFDGGSKAVAAYRLGLWETSTKPVFGLNLNLDYNIYPNLAVRVTPTYLFHTYSGRNIDFFGNPTGGTNGGLQHNPGINVGFIYRFGTSK